MIDNKQRDIANWALDTARKHGAKNARISLLSAINNSCEYRGKQLDQLAQSSESRLYIELYVDDKYASFASNRLEKDELERLIKEGVSTTRYLSKDKCQQLADSSRYFKQEKELENFDSSTIATESKLEIAKNAIEEIYGTNDKIISISASYNDTLAAEYMIASNGLEVESNNSNFSLSTEVSLKTDSHARIQDYWYDTAVFWEDLQKEGIAKKALQLALSKIGQTKTKSGKYSMLLDKTMIRRLFNPLLSAASGAAIQQKSSFLLNKHGEQILPQWMNIQDRPHMNRAMGARLYDGEGVATKNSEIISNGVLNNYFINTYYSHKLETEATISSPSIICLNNEGESLEAMMKSVKKGIWVTGFNGGNTNSISGDFSFGIEGF